MSFHDFGPLPSAYWPGHRSLKSQKGLSTGPSPIPNSSCLQKQPIWNYVWMQHLPSKSRNSILKLVHTIYPKMWPHETNKVPNCACFPIRYVQVGAGTMRCELRMLGRVDGPLPSGLMNGEPNKPYHLWWFQTKLSSPWSTRPSLAPSEKLLTRLDEWLGMDQKKVGAYGCSKAWSKKTVENTWELNRE
jgi:hypothetical protein